MSAAKAFQALSKAVQELLTKDRAHVSRCIFKVDGERLPGRIYQDRRDYGLYKRSRAAAGELPYGHLQKQITVSRTDKVRRLFEMEAEGSLVYSASQKADRIKHTKLPPFPEFQYKGYANFVTREAVFTESGCFIPENQNQTTYYKEA